jgi:choline-glycine betaine transporter
MTNSILITTLAFFQQAANTAQQAETQVLTGGGWLFMSAAWAFILILTFYTFGKILRGSGKK